MLTRLELGVAVFLIEVLLLQLLNSSSDRFHERGFPFAQCSLSVVECLLKIFKINEPGMLVLFLLSLEVTNGLL